VYHQCTNSKLARLQQHLGKLLDTLLAQQPVNPFTPCLLVGPLRMREIVSDCAH